MLFILYSPGQWAGQLLGVAKRHIWCGCGYDAIFGVGVFNGPCASGRGCWMLSAVVSSVRNLILQFLFGCCVVGVPAIVGILLES